MPLWINAGGTTWKEGVPYRSNGTVYRPVAKVFRHNGTIWQEVWARNIYPPTAPTVALSLKSGTKNVLNVNVKTAATQPSKIARAVVKLGVNRWPTGPDDNDGCYYAHNAITPNGTYEKWSEWWVSTRPNNPLNQNGTKQFPATEMTSVTLPLDTNIMVSAWLQDEHGQWSTAGTAQIRTLKADQTQNTTPDTGYVPTLRTPLVVSANWFSSYLANNAQYAYRNGLGHAVQGDTPHDSQGLLRSLIGFPSFNQNLRDADIVKIEVEVYMLHWHYVSGGVLSIGLHPHLSTPATFTHNASSVVLQRYTARGQRLWTTIPEQYYAGFKSGLYRGISLYRQSSDPTYYGYADAMATRLRVHYKA